MDESGYNTKWYVKDWERKSTQRYLSREPRLVERGIEKAAEDGPGVGGSIGRPARVRPLLRFEADIFCHSEGNLLPVGIPISCWGLPHQCAHWFAMTVKTANQGGTTIDSSLRCKGDFLFIRMGRPLGNPKQMDASMVSFCSLCGASRAPPPTILNFLFFRR